VSLGFACALALNTTIALADQIWEQRYHGPGRLNRATAVAVDNAGNVAVTGFSDNTSDDPNNYGFNDGYPYYYARGRADYYTVKYAAGDGHMLWEKRYNGIGEGDDVATDVKMDGAGNVIVTGYSWNLVGWTGGRTHDFYTAKYAAADGALLWEHRGPDWNQRDVRMALDSSGNVVVTGQASGPPNFGGYYTAKYAAANGSLLWEQRFFSTVDIFHANQNTYTWGAPAVDSAGNVVVTGTSVIEPGIEDIYTEKYAAADGHVIWTNRYHSPGSLGNHGNAVAVDSNDNVVVTGHFVNTDGAIVYYTAKYATSDGGLLWEQQYHNTATGSWGVMALDSAGNAFVTAWTSAGAFVVKYAGADGQQLWVQPYRDSCTPGADYPRAIGVNSAGDVNIAGIGYDGDPNSYGHYHTVRLAASDGQLLWQANYVGPGNLGSGRDDLSALAVDGSGNVVVTGYSQASSGDYFTGSFDYATVKYSPSGAGPGTIACPSDIVTSAAPGQCSAVVNFTLPAATDPCGNQLVVTASPPSGSAFSKGVTTVVCAASGGPTCTFNVTVNDRESPSITCPANVIVSCGTDLLVPVSFSATASDNCDPHPTITYSKSPGSGFPIGTTTVTCSATDASGNQASGSFTVTRASLGFTGFLEPIGGADGTGGSFGDPMRTFKLKSTIPVKFKATCDGSPVLTGVHTLQAIKYSSQTTGDTPIDATPVDAATTGNQFRLSSDEWHFNLDTKATGMSAGIWLLRATLSDASQHTAWIQIK